VKDADYLVKERNLELDYAQQVKEEEGTMAQF
jgi:hypothetical protein